MSFLHIHKHRYLEPLLHTGHLLWIGHLTRIISLRFHSPLKHYHSHFTDGKTESQRHESFRHNWIPVSHCPRAEAEPRRNARGQRFHRGHTLVGVRLGSQLSPRSSWQGKSHWFILKLSAVFEFASLVYSHRYLYLRDAWWRLTGTGMASTLTLVLTLDRPPLFISISWHLSVSLCRYKKEHIFFLPFLHQRCQTACSVPLSVLTPSLSSSAKRASFLFLAIAQYPLLAKEFIR